MKKKRNVITSIKRQTNRPRYNIYINGEYAFAVHEDIVVKFRLLKGKEIEEEEMARLLKAEERNRAIQYGLRYLGYRARSSAEMRDYLSRKGFEPEDCEAAIETFANEGYIDDEDYAERWIEERKRLRPRGRHLLKQELIQRGLEPELAERAIRKHVSDEEEMAMISELIEKKWRGKTFDRLYDAKKKMIPYLRRKGFSMELIASVIERVGPTFIKEESEE